MKPIKDPKLYAALSKVEDLLEKGWIKGKLKTHEGYCIMGAIDEICWGVGRQDLWVQMRDAVTTALPQGLHEIAAFNDSPITSFAEVQDVLHKARESAL
jgi:hypothetical protein